VSPFPTHRSRRLRRSPALRRLVRETRLSADQLVAPLFVRHGSRVREEISSLPGVFRLSPDEALAACQELSAARVPAVILFGIPERKDETGSEGWDDDAAVQSTVRLLKKELPGLLGGQVLRDGPASLGPGVGVSGDTATIPVDTASLNVPASGARASGIVLGAKGLPLLLWPAVASLRCQVKITSGVMSRNLRSPRHGRT